MDVQHPDDVHEIFDNISYAKGSAVVRMLRAWLGEKEFQAGLQLYLKRHSYSNAQTDDLWRALEEATGQPVGKVANNWTKLMGRCVEYSLNVH